MTTAKRMVSLPVIPASASSINWTQIVGILSAILVFMFGSSAGLTPEQQNAIATTLVLTQGGVTFVIHTFFAHGVPSPSVDPVTPPTPPAS
jgi:hypothetical protein